MTKNTFDFDSFQTYQMDNKYYAQVSASETSNCSYYDEGGPVPEAVIIETAIKYILVYEESLKKWLVDDTSMDYDFSAENKKEFTF